MRFALTPEQEDLRDVVRDLMERGCPPAVVRGGPDSAQAAVLERELTEIGASGILLPETDGGLGLDENYLVPVLTETGRAAAPLPVVETVAVAPTVLAAAGLRDRVGARAAADPTGRGDVRFAAGARLLLRGGWAGEGTIDVIELAHAELTPVVAMDPAAGLRRITGGRRIAVVDDPVVVERAWHRGVLGTAAQLIGLARRMLDMTVEYVGTRRQFGVPVGSFQAVKHHLATALMQVEFAEPAVARAGFSLATDDPDRDRDVAVAKALASEAATAVARTAIQCHGAIAYTTEYDLHLYAKRAWALAAEWGSAAWHRARTAAHLGLPMRGTVPAH